MKKLFLALVLSLPWRRAQFANSLPRSEFIFANEMSLDDAGWAMVAPYGDYEGVALVPQPGGSVRKFKAIQRLNKAAAETMVRNFKSPIARIKRFVGMTHCPIYLGHPDAPGIGGRYPDKAAKGGFADLQARENGLFGLPIFTNEGEDLVATKRYGFSGRWTAEEVGEENGLKIFQPEILHSAGLTDNPRLPVELLNDADDQQQEKDKMNLALIIAALAKYGVQLANDATEQQLITGIDTLGGKAASVAQLTNDKSTLESTLTTERGTITTLTTERDGLRTEFNNERASRIDLLLDGAVADGRITQAQRAEWKTKLAVPAQFANESAALQKLEKTIKIHARTQDAGARKVEMANEADRRSQVQTLITAELPRHNNNYDAAFAAVQKANPALFEQMQKPAAR